MFHSRPHSPLSTNPADPAVTIVACACAASAGVHAALIPEHLREAAPLGILFVLAVILLLTAAAALVARPEGRLIARGVALLLAALIASWAASTTTGLVVVQPEPEAVDVVGVLTKLIEAIGLGCAIWLSQPSGGRRLPTTQEDSR